MDHRVGIGLGQVVVDPQQLLPQCTLAGLLDAPLSFCQLGQSLPLAGLLGLDSLPLKGLLGLEPLLGLERALSFGRLAAPPTLPSLLGGGQFPLGRVLKGAGSGRVGAQRLMLAAVACLVFAKVTPSLGRFALAQVLRWLCGAIVVSAEGARAGEGVLLLGPASGGLELSAALLCLCSAPLLKDSLLLLFLLPQRLLEHCSVCETRRCVARFEKMW
jgi:hypothetical protein